MVAASAGCAGVTPERGHDQVSALVGDRTGHKTRWEKGPPDDAQIADWVRKVTAAGLTQDRAVEIALVNNPSLQTTYEELGVSQADMVQAGLLRNPAFGLDLGFRLNNGKTDEVRVSLVQDLLDLLVLPLRKQIGREEFEAATLNVANRALEVAAETQKAFVLAQADVELVAFRRTVVEGAAAAADLSARQLEAGNVSELDRATEAANYQQAKLDLAREEIDLLEAREKVNRLLGLWGETTSWRFAEELPPMPSADPKLDHLESFAMSRRLDVAVAKRRAALLSKAVDLARSTRLIGRLDVGVDMHQDPNGPLLLGPNLVIELPIFDQRQAVIARLEAQRREMERRLQEVAIDARSEVRLAALRLDTGRQMVSHYREVLVPLRKTISEQALLHYNGMFISAFQLLTVKQGEIDARRGYLESLRDYWIARAELARALGGSLPLAPSPSAAPAAPPPTSPPPPPAPASDGDHHGH
ncbi:MAG TPA: TolC family protein [Polyangia bacterium]|nr:TolC family protein [Polyangia bacterium]